MQGMVKCIDVLTDQILRCHSREGNEEVGAATWQK